MNVRQRIQVLLLPLVVILVAPLAWGNGFTLEQILNTPFPSDLVASKLGDKVAWVFDLQGKRNIWVAEAPTFKGRQLTRYDKDDGQEITEPVFSPDGAWIAYVHGGPPNSDKDIPNPTSDPAGAKQEVWLVHTRTGATVRVAEGSSPMFSPLSASDVVKPARCKEAVAKALAPASWSTTRIGLDAELPTSQDPPPPRPRIPLSSSSRNLCIAVAGTFQALRRRPQSGIRRPPLVERFPQALALGATQGRSGSEKTPERGCGNRRAIGVCLCLPNAGRASSV